MDGWHAEIRDGDVWEITQPLNGDNATLWGVELAYQNQFRRAPGLLSGFGIYLNYTWTDSEATIPGRDGDSPLPGQPRRVPTVSAAPTGGELVERHHTWFGSYSPEMQRAVLAPRVLEALAGDDPFASLEFDKQDVRLNLVVARVTETGLPMIYLNQVGGQDELVFDGGSFVTGADGRVAVAGRRRTPLSQAPPGALRRIRSPEKMAALSRQNGTAGR